MYALIRTCRLEKSLGKNKRVYMFIRNGRVLDFFEVLYFVKMCPIFDGSMLTDFEKYEKNHLAPINIDLKDYWILGTSLQIVLP